MTENDEVGPSLENVLVEKLSIYLVRMPKNDTNDTHTLQKAKHVTQARNQLELTAALHEEAIDVA